MGAAPADESDVGAPADYSQTDAFVLELLVIAWHPMTRARDLYNVYDDATLSSRMFVWVRLTLTWTC